MTAPLMQFTSHIDGRNAQVTVWPDRLEWTRPGYGAGAKVALWVLALFTYGISLLFPAARPWRRGSHQMLAVRACQGVTANPAGPATTNVVVSAGAGVMVMRVSNSIADQVRELMTQLVLGQHPTQRTA